MDAETTVGGSGFVSPVIEIPPTCSTCKWWGDGETCGEADGIRVECCTNPMVVQPSYGEHDNRNMRSDGVLTCDEGGDTGKLMTGPDFGCIHHAPNFNAQDQGGPVMDNSKGILG